MAEIHVNPLPEQHWQAALDILVQASTAGLDETRFVIETAGVAYVYWRKENWSTTTIGRDRNPSYGSERDDVLVTLTVRIDHDAAMNMGVRDLESALVREQIETVEQERDDAAAEMSRADARLQELRDRLAKK